MMFSIKVEEKCSGNERSVVVEEPQLIVLLVDVLEVAIRRSVDCGHGRLDNVHLVKRV